MFKVNNKETRTTPLTSFWCLECYFWAYFTPLLFLLRSLILVICFTFFCKLASNIRLSIGNVLRLYSSVLNTVSHDCYQILLLNSCPAGIYLLKVNWRFSGVFIVNFEHISHLVLLFIKFEQVNAGWVARSSV